MPFQLALPSWKSPVSDPGESKSSATCWGRDPREPASALRAQIEAHWFAEMSDRPRANGRPNSPRRPPSTAASCWAPARRVWRELPPSRAEALGGLRASTRPLLASPAARVLTRAPRACRGRACAHRRLPHLTPEAAAAQRRPRGQLDRAGAAQAAAGTTGTEVNAAGPEP